jgi:hypothetical protein
MAGFYQKMALFGVFTFLAIVGLLVWGNARNSSRTLDGVVLFGMGACGMAALVLFTVLEHFRGSRPPQPPPPGAE